MLVVAFVAWWQWPVVAARQDRTEVLVVGDEFLTGATTPIGHRVHESGRTLQWAPPVDGWCEVPALLVEEVRRVDPVSVVVSAGDASACGATVVADVRAAIDGRILVVVLQPGRAQPAGAVDGHRLRAVDPTRLIGASAVATDLPCQWWETCGAGGVIAVRNPDGSLTDAGGERVARLVVAELP